MDSQQMREAFTKIRDENYWGGLVSRSGRGSDADQTRVMRRALEDFVEIHKVRSLLDLGCGDMGWISPIRGMVERYVGVDIVPGDDHVVADVTRCPIGAFDLVLCRDVLCHLEYPDSLRLLDNVRRSGSTYFASTTFPDHTNPPKSPGVWAWFAINLTEAPFNLPFPGDLLWEECPDDGFGDKSLGIWLVEKM